ncbi:M20 metallopeptidase family protein [Oceanobacillus damuensis]|uniref:M20 metallopeptidase family protein n=1 Tax=Oceanobacillus damuensis TaxID=937928 RepID=UPI0008327C6B|nr:M20 family metallopeptidase [Oceanobacillus damuensis]
MNELLYKTKKMDLEVRRWRRTLHQYPELGFEEFNTSNFILRKLNEFNINNVKRIAGTGLVGLIKGKKEGPTILLRADIDGLPINDEKKVNYASKVNGKAHLCGHDAHTSILLCALKVIKDHGIERGNVKFIFQPAEEGLAGAKKVIEEGVLENPKVDTAVGLHVYPNEKTGRVAICPGPCTSFSDRFNLTIIGKGGHAAHPHMAVDALAIGSIIVNALQQVVSRQIDPLSPSVLTIGKISGGSAYNAIASSVTLEGTVRLLDESLRYEVKQKIEDIVRGICSSFDATFELNYHHGYPSVVNDEALIPKFKQTVSQILGEDSFSIINPSMGGEDFSYYTQKVPGLFFRLGTRCNEETSYPLHHPKFDIDEEALSLGAALLSQYALNFLHHHDSHRDEKINLIN